ncbi:MAG: Cna B-type domain-containing protein [Clostridiales bacterium]|nr:Cna B-type domain-containing protein [Clostridiales bacterium]
MKMKIYKRTAVFMCCLFLCTLFIPIRTLAAGSIDLTHEVSLTVSYQDGTLSLSDAQIDLYQVAAVDEYGELTSTDIFDRFHIDIRGKNDEAWRTLAFTLEGYILRDNISPFDSGKTNQAGLISFPSAQKKLIPGLYLVLGQRHTQNGYYYDMSPFLVMLPSLDQKTNTWSYHVTAEVKYDVDPVPDGPDTIEYEVLKVWKDGGYEHERPQEITVQLLRNGEIYDTVTLNDKCNWRYIWTDLDGNYKWTVVEKEQEKYTVEVVREGVTFAVINTYAKDIPDNEVPKEPASPSDGKLPQTGQLWWPVPLLIAVGLLCIVIGLLRRRSASDEEK